MWVDALQLMDRALEATRKIALTFERDVANILSTSAHGVLNPQAQISVESPSTILQPYIHYLQIKTEFREQESLISGDWSSYRQLLLQKAIQYYELAQQYQDECYEWLQMKLYSKILKSLQHSLQPDTRQVMKNALTNCVRIYRKRHMVSMLIEMLVRYEHVLPFSEWKDWLPPVEDIILRVADDINSQLEYVREQIPDISYKMAKLMHDLNNKALLHEVHFRWHELVIKLRHLLDQCWMRCIAAYRHTKHDDGTVLEGRTDNFPMYVHSWLKEKNLVSFESDCPEAFAVSVDCTNNPIWKQLVLLCNAKHAGVGPVSSQLLADRMGCDFEDWFIISYEEQEYPMLKLLQDGLKLVEKTATTLSDTERRLQGTLTRELSTDVLSYIRTDTERFKFVSQDQNALQSRRLLFNPIQ